MRGEDYRILTLKASNLILTLDKIGKYYILHLIEKHKDKIYTKVAKYEDLKSAMYKFNNGVEVLTYLKGDFFFKCKEIFGDTKFKVKDLLDTKSS